ncbi:50S ribosomal protein L5 [Candidatus Bathyarchaeota archaeon]|nr:50S ribosomal protein L5 [Candidatus Bathyarchaeota archaeon]
MRRIRIGKVVVSISVGRSGEPLEKAVRILQDITGHRPSQRRAKKTIKTFGIRKGEPIACMVTLRGGDADAFLRRALDAVGRRLKQSSFDDEGNVSFGLKEHIEIPGVKYDPELGIYGMNINVHLERPGYRVKRRRRCPSDIGKTHKVTRGEAVKFMEEAFSVQVGG